MFIETVLVVEGMVNLCGSLGMCVWRKKNSFLDLEGMGNLCVCVCVQRKSILY